jgi:hypothetical protein
VVYWKLANPITEIDIQERKPELINRNRPTYPQKATDDSDSSSVKCENFNEPTGFWDGSEIRFLSGDNEGTIVYVDHWDKLTNKFELAENLNYASSRNDKFELKRSFEKEINSAWTSLFHTIQSWVPKFTSLEGLNRLVDPLDLRELHMALSIIRICENLSSKKEDVFDRWKVQAENDYQKALNELRLKIDSNDDGIPEAERQGMGTWFKI